MGSGCSSLRKKREPIEPTAQTFEELIDTYCHEYKTPKIKGTNLALVIDEYTGKIDSLLSSGPTDPALYPIEKKRQLAPLLHEQLMFSLKNVQQKLTEAKEAKAAINELDEPFSFASFVELPFSERENCFMAADLYPEQEEVFRVYKNGTLAYERLIATLTQFRAIISQHALIQRNLGFKSTIDLAQLSRSAMLLLTSLEKTHEKIAEIYGQFCALDPMKTLYEEHTTPPLRAKKTMIVPIRTRPMDTENPMDTLYTEYLIDISKLFETPRSESGIPTTEEDQMESGSWTSSSEDSIDASSHEPGSYSDTDAMTNLTSATRTEDDQSDCSLLDKMDELDFSAFRPS